MTKEREEILEGRLMDIAYDLMNICKEVGYSIHVDANHYADIDGSTGVNVFLHPNASDSSSRLIWADSVEKIAGCITKANKEVKNG